MVVLSALSDEGSDGDSMIFNPDSDVWADLVPVPQEDGPEPLCPILYDRECAPIPTNVQILKRWIYFVR